MNKLAIATVSIIPLLTAPVLGADFPLKTPPSQLPQTLSWTGLYVGMSLGGRWAETTWNTLALGALVGPPDSSTPASFNRSAFRVGGYVGYNWQVAPIFVLGVEGDLAWARSNKTQGGIPGAATPSFGSVIFDSASATFNWDGGLRGRAGVLVSPSWLVYLTGGVTWQEFDVNATCFGTPTNSSWCNAVRNETVSTTRIGGTVGGGVETMLWRNVLLRAEYRFADFGTINHTFFQSTPDDLAMRLTPIRTHTAFAGIGYKF